MDGVEGQAYVRVGEPAFSPDSRHVAYEASRRGSGAKIPSLTGFSEAVIVVDGVASEGYPLILAQQGFIERLPGGVAQVTLNLPQGEGLALAFTGPFSLRFVAARSAGANQSELFRVDMEIAH